MDTNTELQKLQAEFEIQKQIAFKSGQLQSDITVWSLLQSIAEGVVIVDAQGRILLINTRLDALLGYKLEELIGQPLDILIPERFRTSHTGKVAEFFADPRIRPMGTGVELFALRKDGSEIPVEISLSFLNTSVGQLGLAFLSDVSARRKVENALREQNAELDTFASAVAHNLRSTINGIVGVSELLQDDGVDGVTPEERQEYLTILLDSGRKMGDVVRELLLFARLKQEEAPLGPIKPLAIIDSIQLRLRGLISQSNATVVVAENLHIAFAYDGWVEEVLYNLVTNAIRYGGTPPIVRIFSELLPSDEVAYRVSDNGPGLTEELIQILLGGHSAERNQYVRGHGLGLPIAKSIAAKLGGRVEGTSAIGDGSVFSLILPSCSD